MRLPTRPAARYALIAVLVVVALCATGAAVLTYGILYRQWESPTVRALAAWSRFPAARVSGRTVTYTAYLAQLDALRTFLSGSAAQSMNLPSAVTADYTDATLSRAVRIVAVEKFADERNIVVTPLDVDRSYDSVRERAGTSTTPGEIQAFIKDTFGMDEAQFKTSVIRPALLEDLLKQKAFQQTQDAEAFPKELEAYVTSTAVVRYLRFR